MDTLDKEYYKLVADNITNANLTPNNEESQDTIFKKLFHFMLMEKDILRLPFNLQDYMRQNTIG